MTVWFTSDPHFGHQKIAETRDFESSDEHDMAIAEFWLDQVRPDDQVWILGDLHMAQMQYALDFIKGLPGQKHLVAGNHDAVHPMHRSSHRYQRRYLEAFDSVQAFARRRIAGREVLLSHFPYNTDHTNTVRYTQYRLRDEGRWLLHGHTHGKERLHGHEIHVGLDAWNLQFVKLETLAQMIRESERERLSGSPPAP